MSNDCITPAEARTLDGAFRERVRRTPQAEAYRAFDAPRNQWYSLTWAQAGAEVARWQGALRAEQLAPGDRVAVLLPNCPAWVMFEQAALGLGLVVVPLYNNDRPDNIAFILQDSGARVLLCDGALHWPQLESARDTLERLTRVVMLNPPLLTQDVPANTAYSRDWLPAQAQPLQSSSAAPGDLASIVYTSGTTGRPKGVMLSHDNILQNAYAGTRCADLFAEDVFLSFLPLSHMLERTAGHYIPMLIGAAVAYARSVPQLAEDLLTVKPTVLISVPRIYERVHAKIQAQLAEKSAIARWLFQAAVRIGWRRFEWKQGRARWSPLLLDWPLYNLLVARKIQQKLGGRLRIAICGGAPLPVPVARTFLGLGVNLLQGYGLTETSPVISVNRLADNDPASVGQPLPGVEARVGANNELLARGPSVMLGYWNNPQATAQTVDADGWLHTGDQVRIENNRIYITGRLKEIIVLSNGEKIAPADMEMAISLDPLFAQSMILGEGRPYLSVMASLNPEEWEKFARQAGLATDDVAGKKAEAAVLERIAVALRNFPGYAQVRRAHVTLEQWTVENGLLTPTLKLRRKPVLERYPGVSDRLYAGH